MISIRQAYKNALRATHVAFKGDTRVLDASRARIKQEIFNHKDLSGEKLEEEINKLEEVSKFLIGNIVQGQRQDDGKYFLNFHQNTELGDNETIKQGKKADLGSLEGSKVKKCS